jgi:hypothetical protein
MSGQMQRTRSPELEPTSRRGSAKLGEGTKRNPVEVDSNISLQPTDGKTSGSKVAHQGINAGQAPPDRAHQLGAWGAHCRRVTCKHSEGSISAHTDVKG